MTRIDKRYVASIDIDAQNGFTKNAPDELPVPGGETIVPELNKQAEFARYRIGTKDAHPINAVWKATVESPQFSPVKHNPNCDIHWNMHCVPGTSGFDGLVGLPQPADYDYFVWKGIEPDMHPYGACYHDLSNELSTGLIEWLNANRVKLVILGGLATDYCVKTTGLQLMRAGFKVALNKAACRAIDKKSEMIAIKELRDEVSKGHGDFILITDTGVSLEDIIKK